VTDVDPTDAVPGGQGAAGNRIVEQAVSEEYRSLPYDEARLAELRAELDGAGVVELRDFLSEEGHALLKQQILAREERAEAGHGKFAIKGSDLDDTVVGELARSGYMLELSNGLLGPVGGRAAYVSDPIRSDEIVPGINLMRTTSDVTRFHFDGTFLNMVLAVVIPQISGARRGQLVIYPNMRSFSPGPWGSYAAPLAARSAVLRRLLAGRRREVDYAERGAYLFYGYRSLHGVEAQEQDGFRAITNMTVGGRRFAGR
jgi:hypothetical protein